MPYVTNRAIHDADAHIMETPEMLADFADPRFRAQIGSHDFAHLMGGEGAEALFDELRATQADPDFRARDEAETMSRKNWHATGSFLKDDRAMALDMLGFKSQLMFNTFWNAYLLDLEMGDDVELAYGAAQAHNRAMLDFCAVDKRLLAACYVPLMDFERSAAFTAEVIKAGAKAILVPSACPANHSPSHTGLFPIWRQAEEAGLPIVMHVGGGGQLLDPTYFENGLPAVKDFHGGAENFRSVDYMAIPRPTAQTLATLIIDGIFEAHPALKFGIVELGSVWLPGLMQQLDAAHEAFARHEDRLRKLSLRPSEYVQRQIRITPYPTENTAWVIDQVGEDVCLFSSDFPHVEGGRAPIKRFDASLVNSSEIVQQKFYHDNFVDLMGAGLG
ncbi:MAG: amidohydrolase family protein [Rhodospirillaceae bacterium]|nr:amidohydrolase family protein [Rhodospirillaceae bacterium]